MRKIILVCLLMLAVTSTAAAALLQPEEPLRGANPTFGETAYYSVLFDGEGEAAVVATIGIKNSGTEPLSSVAIEIPGGPVRVLGAYQQVQVNYKPQPLEYRYSTGYYSTEYHKLTYTSGELSTSTRFVFQLNKSIAEDETAQIIIYYKVRGYAKESGGISSFDFETMKYNTDINQLRVAINVQDGYFLKGGNANVNYRTTFESMSGGMSAPTAGEQTAKLSDTASYIQYESGFVKTAQALDPFESFRVKGTYADAGWKLHVWQIIAGIVITAVAAVLAFLGARKLAAKLKEDANSGMKKSATKAGGALPLARIILYGLGLGAAISGMWSALIFLTKNISYRIAPFMVLLVLGLVAVSILLLVFAGLWFGKHYGTYQGLGIVISAIAGIIILSMIVALIYLSLTQTGIRLALRS